MRPPGPEGSTSSGARPDCARARAAEGITRTDSLEPLFVAAMLFGADVLAPSFVRDATELPSAPRDGAELELSALRDATGLVLSPPRECAELEACALLDAVAPSALFEGGAALFCGALLPFTFASM
jgi:hypothetical protein